MGRTKKKQLISEDAENLNDYSDDDDSNKIHDQLIENIKYFHGKPKISPATRYECAAEVSEFNFRSKKKTDYNTKLTFHEEELLRAIRKRQPKVAQKLQVVKNAKTLPKTLESVYERKIQRKIGYRNIKTDLKKWKNVIQTNRVADQITFPLKTNKIEIYNHVDNDLFSTFSNPTPLEKELAKVLNSSNVAKQDKKKKERNKFHYMLNEMIQKRQMLAKLKAQASYKIAKAHRQNKIKSKKYHRILRNEKTKQQIKDFEKLKETDPEAALKQLESLEKVRAQERATLRHRNTGKWARNQIIKAKYNKEVLNSTTYRIYNLNRIALSEQLSKNRELTQKLHIDEDSAAEESVDINVRIKTKSNENDLNNHWLDGNNEYAHFVTNYKKFWEEKREKECFSDISHKTVVNNKNEESPKSNLKDEVLPQDLLLLNQEKMVKSKKKSVINTAKKYEDDKIEKNNKNIKAADKKKKKKEKRKTINQSEILSEYLNTNDVDFAKPEKQKLINNLATELPDTVLADDNEAVDDDEYICPASVMNMVFTDDDMIEEFKKEKNEIVEHSKAQLVDKTLPGWGSWTGASIQKNNNSEKPKRSKINKRLLYKIPKVPPRKDSNKGHVIINEDKNNKFKEHLVNDVPFPFSQVKDYEASIRAPVGRTWLPEIVHQQFIVSPVVTKLGTVIEPIENGELLKRNEN
ncbi:hypothetical protein PGB90_007344 [Kerria lacca]